MWPRTLMRFSGVFVGVIIGLGVAGILVAWTNEGHYMKQKPVDYDARECCLVSLFIYFRFCTRRNVLRSFVWFSGRGMVEKKKI